MAAIEIQNLTKRYGKARGIDHVSLTVEQGEFFGFIGPNGAGKSTTIRTLLGFLKPTEGSAQIFGGDVWKDRTRNLTKVGYLPSESFYYPGMKVSEAIALSVKLRGQDCRVEAAQLCEALQLDTGKKAAELSFGNRKKLAIVCALQHNPDLLILDEPTSGLDPLMQKAFFDILEQRHERGTTIFLSSHILSEIQRFCDRAAVIRNGRIIACDSIERLGGQKAKKISFSGNADLSGLKGIKHKTEDSETTSFLYRGDMDQLVKTLAKGSISDLTIEEPDLEEVFMHFYEGV